MANSRLCLNCRILVFDTFDKFSASHANGAAESSFKDEIMHPSAAVLQRNHISPFYYLPLHSSFGELEHSAKEGCHFCLQIMMSFPPYDVREFQQSKATSDNCRAVWLVYRDYLQLNFPENTVEKRIYLLCHRTCQRLDLLPRGVPLKAMGGELLRRGDLYSISAENEHTGSQLNLELALKWKEDCLQNHGTTCGPVSGLSVPRLPKRVIKVTSYPPSLHTSNEEVAHYAILSHCWGKNKMKPIRTTARNLSERHQGIPWEFFPKTYQDAIEATRGMKIEYLWIDALCILQKDKSGADADSESTKDWLEESLKMGDYYGNATVTILASFATDDTIGCFAKRNPLSFVPCDIQVRTPQYAQEVEVTSWLSNASGPEAHWSLPSERGDWRNAPLNRRAWCLQESSMSARMLSFEKEQMTWVCFARQANELSPDGQGIPGTYTFFNDFKNVVASGRGAKIPHMSLNSNNGNYVWEAWRHMIEDLTQRDIYTGSDLLPAVSGLAQYVQKVLSLKDESYLAGIWEADLCPSLLWTTQERISKLASQPSDKVPCRNGRHPSWSWASVDNGNITFAEQGSGREREFSTVCTTAAPAKILPLPGSNRFGQISAGHLFLQGGLIEAQVGSEVIYTDLPEREFYRSRMRLEDPQTKELVGFFAPDELNVPVETSTVWLFPLRHWRNKRILRDKLSALVLLPTGDIDGDFGYPEYRRVGIATHVGIQKIASGIALTVAII